MIIIDVASTRNYKFPTRIDSERSPTKTLDEIMSRKVVDQTNRHHSGLESSSNSLDHRLAICRCASRLVMTSCVICFNDRVVSSAKTIDFMQRIENNEKTVCLFMDRAKLCNFKCFSRRGKASLAQQVSFTHSCSAFFDRTSDEAAGVINSKHDTHCIIKKL